LALKPERASTQEIIGANPKNSLSLFRPIFLSLPLTVDRVLSMTSKLKPRSNLETFLLALIEAGVRTPYDMMSKAGVSLGSSLPALNRLSKAGLLQVSPGPARRIRVFTPTEKGLEALERERQNQLKSTPHDLDSILRTASLVWVDGKECNRFLKEAGARLKLRLKKQRDSAKATANVKSALQDRYRWLRRSIEVTRREAEIAALFDLSRKVVSKNK
jgi:DNA-binding PadR family transcriptional regulator